MSKEGIQAVFARRDYDVHVVRARNEWYFGNPNEIKGILYNGGQEIAQQSFYGPAQQ